LNGAEYQTAPNIKRPWTNSPEYWTELNIQQPRISSGPEYQVAPNIERPRISSSTEYWMELNIKQPRISSGPEYWTEPHIKRPQISTGAKYQPAPKPQGPLRLSHSMALWSKQQRSDSEITIVYIVLFRDNYRNITTNTRISIFTGAEAPRTVGAGPLRGSMV
jgi:hypothetical protein